MVTFEIENILFYKAVKLFENQSFQESFPLFLECFKRGNLHAPFYLKFLCALPESLEKNQENQKQQPISISKDQSKELKELDEQIALLPSDLKLDAWCESSKIIIKILKCTKEKQKNNLVAKLALWQKHAPNAIVFLYRHYGLDKLTSTHWNTTPHVIKLIKSILGQADLYILYHLKDEFKKYRVLSNNAASNLPPEFVFKSEIKEAEELIKLHKLSNSPFNSLIESIFSKYYNGPTPQCQHPPFDRNLVRKTNWQMRAISFGNKDLQLVFALWYKNNQNEAQFTFWLQQAAQNGENQAQIIWGIQNFTGTKYVKKDVVKARLWLEKGLTGKRQPDDVEDKSGFATAYTILGNMHERGEAGFEASDKTALEFYLKAHHFGNPTATYNIGVFYNNGRVNKKDTNLAIEYFQKSIDLIDINRKAGSLPEDSNDMNDLAKSCHFDMAQIYLSGSIEVKQDLAKAFLHFSAAAELGDRTSQYKMARMQFDGLGTEKNQLKAIEQLIATALKGCLNSGQFLGTLYISNNDDFRKLWARHKIDDKKIEQFLLTSLEQKNYCDDYITSYPALGYLYFHMLITHENLHKGFQLLSKGASLKQPESLIMLGNIYEQGCAEINIPQDFKKAYEYYCQSAELGNPAALNNKGYFLVNGKGVLKNVEEGKLYYEQALKKNYMLAAYGLYGIYRGREEHRVTEQAIDNKKAVEYLMKALESKDSDVYFDMGVECHYGTLFPRDVEKALYYFKLSANAGNTKAAHNYAVVKLLDVFSKPELFAKDLEDILPHLEEPAQAGYSVDILLKNMIQFLLDPKKKKAIIAELNAAIANKPYRRSQAAIELLTKEDNVSPLDIFFLLFVDVNSTFYQAFEQMRNSEKSGILSDNISDKTSNKNSDVITDNITNKVSNKPVQQRDKDSSDKSSNDKDSNDKDSQILLDRYQKLKSNIAWFNEDSNRKSINLSTFKQFFGHLMKMDDFIVEIIPSKSSGTRFKVSTKFSKELSKAKKTICFSYHPTHKKGRAQDAEHDPNRSRSIQNFVNTVAKEFNL